MPITQILPEISVHLYFKQQLNEAQRETDLEVKLNGGSYIWNPLYKKGPKSRSEPKSLLKLETQKHVGAVQAARVERICPKEKLQGASPQVKYAFYSR